MCERLGALGEGVGWAGAVHVLGHGVVDAEGLLEVGLLHQLQDHLHVLAALLIAQAVLHLLQGEQQLLQLCRGRHTKGGMNI